MEKESHEHDFQKLRQLAIESGASDVGVIPAADIRVEERFAAFCRQPRCESYGLSPSCPPHVSGPPGFRELIKNFSRAMVVRIDVPSDILLSAARREVMRLLHETVSTIELAAVKMGYGRSQGFAGGSCKKIFCHEHAGCRVLTEKKGCRHPDQARPSMSGFGIDVAKLMQAAGWDGTLNALKAGAGKESMSWVAGLVLIG